MSLKQTFTVSMIGLVLTTLLTGGCHSSGGHTAHRGCNNGSCGATAAPAPHSPSPAFSSAGSLPHDRGTNDSARGSAIASRAQRTCPVTGEELGSMGDPISVTVKDETIFVCCQGCVKKVQQNPDKYLAKVHAETRA